jgi:uncharacterized RDD family membrane protein YckC
VGGAPWPYAVGVSDETDAFGRPLRPEATDPFGAPVEPGRGAPATSGWAPPQAPPDTDRDTRWEPPVSPTRLPGSEPAGWWRRVGATLIDGLIIGTAGAVIASIVARSADASEDATTGIAAALGLLLGAMYYGLLMSRPGERNGQTWGKQATEIRVVRTDGQPITFAFALVRELLVKTVLFGYVAVLTLYVVTLLNYLWPLWDERNRALHDRIVSTLVRRT